MTIYIIKIKDGEHAYNEHNVMSFSDKDKAYAKYNELLEEIHKDKFEFINKKAYVEYIDRVSVVNEKYDKNFYDETERYYTEANRIASQLRSKYSHYGIFVLDVYYVIEELEVID